MCGIAGFIDFSGALKDPQTALRGMAGALAHRGPDAIDIWFHEQARVGLAHTRLKIIDCTNAAAQPMRSPSGRYMVIFNGEIYNYQELREELRALGCVFDSQSDTEVLLAAVDTWGVLDAARRSVGMFAFAVHDSKERVLHLARDRVGVKPLHFGWIGSGSKRVFAFASELKALVGLPGFERAVDRDALAGYMQFLYVPAPRTIWRGISKLAPAHIMSLNTETGDSRTTMFWNARAIAERGVAEPFGGTDAQAVDALFTRIQSAVESHMVSDVPIGAFLSGGMDSSLVAAVMQSLSGDPIRTFTVGFQESQFDESPHASNIAKHLKTDHTRIEVSSHELLDAIPLLAHIFDEPFADSSQLPTYLISRATRKHVTVALSGDGGDELFAGYNRHRFMMDAWPALRRIPAPIRATAASILGLFSTRSLDAAGKIAAPFLPRGFQSIQFGDHLHKLASLSKCDDWFEAYTTLASAWGNPGTLVLDSRREKSLDHHLMRANMPDALRATQWLDQTNYLVDDILTKLDRASMAASLETRVPLLDHRLVEFAWTLPAKMKVRDGQGKWILREVLERFLPKQLVDRPKAGFAIPLESWLRGPLRDWADGMLSDKRVREQGFLDPIVVDRHWKRFRAGAGGQQHQTWALVMWMAWVEHWRPTS